MEHRYRAPVRGLVWLSVLFAAGAALAGPDSGSSLVGNTASTERNAASVDFHKWGTAGPKGADQRDVNKPITFRDWTQQTSPGVFPRILEARADLAAAAAKDTDLAAKLATIPANQKLGDDLHPVEFTEWLKLQSDVSAQFIRPPPNKIKIVDQEALTKMSAAEKAALQGKVKYRKTTVIPRTVTYKPIYKTIEVAYPG